MHFVQPKNPEAASPTRNVNAERGVGRSYRSDPDMTPRIAATMTIKSGAVENQGKLTRERTDLIGRTGRSTIVVRSGNTDPAAIGINKDNWGIAGVGDEAPAVASKSNPLLLIGVVAAIGAVFLLARKKS